jgi:hypothetical protein
LWASSAVEKLRAQVTIKSSVLRDGKPQMIPSEPVVPGDVVPLSAVSKIELSTANGREDRRRAGGGDILRALENRTLSLLDDF